MRARNVREDANFLVLRRYLAVSPDGVTKLSANPPPLGPNSIAIGLKIEIPKALFRKPQLEATITVPAEAGAPKLIEANVVGDMKEAIKQATGLEVAIRVAPENT